MACVHVANLALRPQAPKSAAGTLVANLGAGSGGLELKEDIDCANEIVSYIIAVSSSGIDRGLRADG